MLVLERDLVAALDVPMTEEPPEQISALALSPPPATDRTETLTSNWA